MTATRELKNSGRPRARSAARGGLRPIGTQVCGARPGRPRTETRAAGGVREVRKPTARGGQEGEGGGEALVPRLSAASKE